MKLNKIMLAVMAAATMSFVSCSQEEAIDTQASENTTAENANFTVVEEKEMTGSELFETSMQGMSQYAGMEAYQDMKKAFEEANGTISDDNTTRSFVPTLYKTARITYTTTDQNMQPVTASALIVYPLFTKMHKVMLINHGTQIGFMMIPTNFTSVEAVMAATGSFCVMPDYIGLGASKDHADLYLNHDVHGRTSIDALLAGLDYAEEKGLKLCDDYKTHILGYSQGGSVSLASLREVQRRDKATQARINLDRVFCGDGPYDLSRTFQSYIEDYNEGKKMGLGAVIPMVINSMFNSYPDEVANINYKDFFTEKCWNTGVPEAIRNNSEDVLDVVVKLNGWKLNEIMDMDYTSQNPEDLQLLISLMDRQNLCKGWSPEYKLKLLHCNPDGVVPFSNFEEAEQYLKNDNVETEVVNINTSLISDPLLQHVYGMMVMLKEVFADEY